MTEKFLLDLINIEKKYKNNVLLGTGSDNFILEYDRICYNSGNVLCT